MYNWHVPNVQALLVLLRDQGVASATFSESGALLSVTFGPAIAPDTSEAQSDTPSPRTRSATPRLVPRVDADR